MVIVRIDYDTSSKMKCSPLAAAHFTLLGSISLAKQISQIPIESYITEKKNLCHFDKGFSVLACLKGLEPLAFWSVARRSIQLG